MMTRSRKAKFSNYRVTTVLILYINNMPNCQRKKNPLKSMLILYILYFVDNARSCYAFFIVPRVMNHHDVLEIKIHA